MRNLLPLFVVITVAAAPAAAQTTSSQQPAGDKPKTVTKLVCERVNTEATTGSRLGSAPKVCKKVEVPVEGAGKKSNRGHAPSHSGLAH